MFREPQIALNQRIEFCLDLHNHSVNSHIFYLIWTFFFKFFCFIYSFPAFFFSLPFALKQKIFNLFLPLYCHFFWDIFLVMWIVDSVFSFLEFCFGIGAILCSGSGFRKSKKPTKIMEKSDKKNIYFGFFIVHDLKNKRKIFLKF